MDCEAPESPFRGVGRVMANIEKGIAICYLDFDGVLHHEEVFGDPRRGIYIGEPGHSLFEWAPILESLLEPFPDTRIVLSTSWVAKKSFTFARLELPEGLKRRVIGATFHTRGIPKREFQELPRSVQILADVERRRPDFWFAIDDDDFGWPNWCRAKLVKTNGATGISDVEVQRKILSLLMQTLGTRAGPSAQF